MTALGALRTRKSSSRARWARISVLAGAFAALQTIAGAQSGGGGFSAEERRRLADGGLVTRPRSPGEEWLGGVAFQVIERPVREVWRALEDVAAYRHMFPATELTRDDGIVDGARLVFVRQSRMGITASYWLRLRFDPEARAVHFEVDRSRPRDIADARGFVEIRPYSGQRSRTLVTWAVRTVLGAGFLDGFVRDLVEPWLLRVPTTMKRYLEGAGRERYRN